MPDIDVEGLGRVFYRDVGAGPSVVLLHSALTDRRQWDREVADLSGRYRLIALDFPGFGQSHDPSVPFDPADPLFYLMDQLGIEQAHLVGSSLGGSIAIHAAIRAPERICSLFLAGTGMFGFTPHNALDEPPIYREYEASWEARDIERVVATGAAICLDGLSSFSAPMVETVRQTFLVTYRDRLKNHPWGNPPFVPLNDQDGVLHLEPPTMVVIGEHDTAYCLALADWLEQSVPAVTVYHMRRAAHFPNLSQPEEFRGLLRDWLAVHA